MLWALAALVLLTLVAAYCGLSIYVSKKRQATEQAEQGSSAGFLFDCLDADGSGTITREELRTGLAGVSSVDWQGELLYVYNIVLLGI